jgi:osmotically-inducible protein OsmY
MNLAEFRRSLGAILDNDPRIDLHRDRIVISLDGGVATVTGEVGDIAAKRRALELVAAQPGIDGIVDRLRVRPAEPMGDGAIADHIEQALLRDSAFNECGLRRCVRDERTVVRPQANGGAWIELRVADGVVTFDGEVPSLSHKRLAGALAWWVPGSRDVVNGLAVEPDEEDNEQEILDGLRLVLEKDALVDAAQIRPSCKGAVVTLDGFVASHSERGAAEFDAWALFGVDEVVNRIAVSASSRR